MSILKIDYISFKLIIVSLLNFLRLLFKWISLYFVEKKFVSWRRNHVVKTSCSFFKILQFFSLLVLYVSTFTSFTKSIDVVFLFCCSHMFSRFALKNKYSMNETEIFCEISTFIMFIALVFFSKNYWRSMFF